MREVFIADVVWNKIEELNNYLIHELKLSEESALKRTDRMRRFVKSISEYINYPLCRFKKWHNLGYRCAVFEKTWVFAYEEFQEGIIIRDMSHTALLKDIV